MTTPPLPAVTILFDNTDGTKVVIEHTPGMTRAELIRALRLALVQYGDDSEPEA